MLDRSRGEDKKRQKQRRRLEKTIRSSREKIRKNNARQKQRRR